MCVQLLYELCKKSGKSVDPSKTSELIRFTKFSSKIKRDFPVCPFFGLIMGILGVKIDVIYSIIILNV